MFWSTVCFSLIAVQMIAIGTVYASPYANFFLGWVEGQHVFYEDLTLYTHCIIFWAYYIDDILILWEGTKSRFGFCPNTEQE